MKSLVLILILISGAVSGYFLGDYRGRESRIALEKAIETGKILLGEREASLVLLKRDLAAIDGKYQREMAQLGLDYEKKTAEWEQAKSTLDSTISTQNKKLAELNGDLAKLLVAAGAASGSDKKQVEKKIETLTQTIAALRGNLDGNICLKTPVPRDVLAALGQTDAGSQ